jgi:hypothetical protein
MAGPALTPALQALASAEAPALAIGVPGRWATSAPTPALGPSA